MGDAKLEQIQEGLGELLMACSGKGWVKSCRFIMAARELIERQAAELKEKAAIIERLTPKPMDLAEAARLLRINEHEGRVDWGVDSGMMSVHSFGGGFIIKTRFAIAIAREYEREKEAARG
ncbi:MAG: hypothetical protein P4L67_04270 [Candidatus Pacebacteria bacterium]|nr:hypothetical protein [Candidatus Paceibacterota bacterium]